MFEKQPFIDVYTEMIALYEQQGNHDRAAHYRAMLQIVEDSAGIDVIIRVDGKSVSKQVIAAYTRGAKKR